MSSHPETTLVAEDDVPAIRITREFDAPVANVFAAHADRDIFERWCGPHELTTKIDEWDCRTGGEWSYVSSDADGNEYAFFGSFHEVRTDELMVQTLTFRGFPDSVSLERLTFEPLGDNRCRLTGVSLFDSFEARDGMVASGMEQGVSEGYDKLDDLL